MYRFRQFGKNAIGAALFVLLTVISLRAYGMEILTPTEQQIADAAELKAASWLICHWDLQSPVSGLWRWNPQLKEFEKEIREGAFPIVLIFDQDRQRVLVATAESTSSPQTNATPSATAEADLRIQGEMSARTVADPFLSIFVEAASSSGRLMISQARAKDGRFVAVAHDAGTFSSSPVVVQTAASCSSAADDVLKEKIETARQKWLAGRLEAGSHQLTVQRKGEWVADKKTGCRIWDDTPFPNELITWEGPCAGGMADGHGILSWFFSDGTFYARYDGDMRRGKQNGQGSYTVTDGSHYEGEWHANRPDGLGSYTNEKGEVYKGTWNDGCFLEGNRWAVLGPTPEECFPK